MANKRTGSELDNYRPLKKTCYSSYSHSNEECLMDACHNGDLKMVRLITGYGVSIHILDTAFIEACRCGHLEVVRLLIDGVNLHIINKALHVACRSGHLEIVGLLYIYLLQG